MHNIGPSKAGFRVAEFVALLPIGRTTFYRLPPEQQPRSVRIGKVRVILERPDDYLERLARIQLDGAQQ